MNRPHFPIGGRSTGSLGGHCGQQIADSGGYAGLQSGHPKPTAIENLRRLMHQDSTLSDERISEYRERIARGDFMTRQAAEATASRLMDDGFDLE